MKKIVEWLTDHGYTKLAMWLCQRTGGHNVVYYNSYGSEPDMSCKHCPGDYY